jgi:hypothetical protein
MNARFWVLGRNAEWVKLTLKPGQSLSWAYAYDHDEGWSAHCETWNHRGDHVERAWINNGRDCDGRMSSGGELVCAISDLTARNVDGLAVPEWVTSETWQRDAYAEAAGY